MEPSTRILVVDDDPALRWTSTRVLTRAGYTVQAVETGEEALRLAGEQNPDLVLLDVVLPGMDGLEVCRRIKADPALQSTYVLLFSARRIDTLEQAEGLEVGADGYVIRPVSNRELLARVGAMVRLKHAEDGLRTRTQELAQRVRELDCLYAVAHLYEQNLSLEEKLEAAACLLPSAWQESEIACARVTLDGVHYPAIGCVESPWKLVAPLRIAGVEVGHVQLCYHEEQLFTPGQRQLLETVAEQLSHIIEQAHIEEALQWSEERFRAVFHQAHDGIALTDPSGIVIEWNQAMERITGRPASTVVGRSLWDVESEINPAGRTTPEQRAAMRSDIAHALDTGQVDWLGQTVEHEYHHPDGSELFVAATFFRIKTAKGFLLGNVVRDVTERRQAEAALAREAAINSAMASLASALIHMHSIKDISDLVLEHALQLTGSAEGFAGYIDPTRGHLVVPTMTDEVWDECQVPDHDRAFEHMRGLWGWVIEHREPLLTNAPSDDPRSVGTPPGHIPIRCFLAVPATVSDVLMGEIALVNADHDYGSFDLELVGRLASLYAVAIQRSRTEEALRDSEQRFRSLLESAPDPILLIDEQQRIVYANMQAQESFGYTRPELLGQPVELHVPEYAREVDLHDWMQHDGRPDTHRVRPPQAVHARRKDGTRFPIDIKLSPLVMDGELLVTAIIRDVTEREEARAALQRAHDGLETRVRERTAELEETNRDLQAEIVRRQEAEQALRASEARFRQLATYIDEALWMTDAETGEFLYVSPVFQQMAGLPVVPGSTDPRSLLAAVHPDDRERVAAAITSRHAGYDLELRVQHDDASVHWIRIRSFPIRDSSGRVYRIAGLAQDITDAREAQAAMIQNERLAMAGKLAASLAHEINNPLQSAMGCLDLVQESLAAGDDPGPFLSVVEDELERTARIVAQLRTLSRPSTLRDRRPVDLNALLEQVLVLAKKQLMSNGIRVAWHLAADMPGLQLSPDEMRQVLLNLVLNAVDAMPHGGVLKVITATSEPGGVIVRLVDTGGGMTPGTLKQLFDPFYSTKPEGLGLGLFITQNIVRAHGGRISVDSKVGEGSIFTVWLPLEPPEAKGSGADGQEET